MSAPAIAGVSAGRFRRRNYGTGHGYLLDGKKILSVTKVLSLGMPKPALVNWAAGEAARYASMHWDELSKMGYSEREAEIARAHEKTRNRAARKGTEIHALAEKISHGAEVPVPEEVAGQVNAVVKFLDEWQVEVLVAEGVGCNLGFPYGGTLDLIFRTPHFPGRTFLGDIKSGKGVWGETALQLEAYSRFDFVLGEGGSEIPMSDFGITDHVVIHVREGGYSVVPMEHDEDVFDVFRGAAVVAKAMDGKDESFINSLVGPEIWLPGWVA